MSWFGETFGDSLNSLKGQITKITKEVLADDEASNSSSQKPNNQEVKELEQLCKSKDLEIVSLKDELKKLHDQYKLQREFEKAEIVAEGSVSILENNNALIQKLENELIEVKQERDHLNSCLEELQSEHQINLDQIISLKNKYKSELEILKKEYSSLMAKSNDTLSISNKKDIDQDKNNEASLLKSETNDVQLLLEKEKENCFIAIKNEEKTQSHLKEKLNALLSEIRSIKRDKEMVESEKINIQKENEEIKNRLIEIEKENNENKLNLTLLLNEKAELIEKFQSHEVIESNLSNLIKAKSEIQQKLIGLGHMLSIEFHETVNDNNIVELVSLIEIKVSQMCQELNGKRKEITNGLELEIKNLREENKNFENKIKISFENALEIEKKYQKEISLLKNSLSEMKTQEQDCISQSQTDDVKRLKQEVTQYKNLTLAKNNKISDCLNLLNNAELEVKNFKASCTSLEKELIVVQEERKKLQEEAIDLKNFNFKISQEKADVEDKLKDLELEKTNLNFEKKQFQKRVHVLEKEIEAVKSESEILKEKSEKLKIFISEMEKKLVDMKNENISQKNELKQLKAEVIIKESSLTELIKTNTFFQEEIKKLQAQNNDLMALEKDVKIWKDTSADLQIQLQDIIKKKEEFENQCFKLKNEFKISLTEKDSEIQQLKLTNSNLMKSYKELKCQIETGVQADHSNRKKYELDEQCQKQTELAFQLQEENKELKFRIQNFQEQMKKQMFWTQNQPLNKDDSQQHRRSKSAVETELLDFHKLQTHNNEELMLLKKAIEQEQLKYELLKHQYQEISSKEANAKKEFERLKKHLIEVEDHYTEEAIQNEKIINDLKSKLVAAEEQLQNSSTLYTSLKVRDNQHLESLQSQIRMVSVQRDEFQAKLSAAEDEIQKHKASLMSLQIVLEQFQQDKERELEEVALKYEKQLKCTDDHFRDLKVEVQSLKNQLAEAKNGLKAASRLGEQLEKKTQQVSDLEEQLRIVSSKVIELENNLSSANQVNNGKIDKFLIKNLVIGFVLSPNADRKSQVLRIMASVLDFDQDERNKMGIGANRSSWLSSVLQPKGEAAPCSQSLSEAFIKFLENESRPQPQLKLLPEQLESSSLKTSISSPKPSGRLSELTLPTFNSSQENDSSIILKNVLKDS